MSLRFARLACVVVAGVAFAACRGGSGGVAGPSTALCSGAQPAAPTFAVVTAEVSGLITKNGQPLSEPRTIAFAARDGGSNRFWWNVTTDDAGAFSIALPEGVYDVQASREGLSGGVIRSGFDVRGPTTFRHDFDAVVVSGSVRLAGQPFPVEDTGPGALCIATTGTDAMNLCTVLPAEATFSLEVPRRRAYEISWNRSGEVANTVMPGRIPYGRQSFGIREIAGDTVLDLNVDAPSYVVRGQILVDGGAPPEGAQLWIGGLTLTLDGAGPPTFALRLMGGRYAPLVLLPSLGVELRYWPACHDQGCLVAGDTDWSIDVTASAQPVAVVDGTLDFVAPPGHALAPEPGTSVGTVVLELLSPAPSSVPSLGFHGSPSPSVTVDDQLHFRVQNVAYGTYAVRFEGYPIPTTPGGSFTFAEPLVVDRAQVAWTQAAPLVPVVIDVTMNGRRLPDDTQLDDQPRGKLVFSAGPGSNATSYELDLAETGPAHFERLMLPGRYQVAVHAQTYLGRTHLTGYGQDVLPVGHIDLGEVEVAAGTQATQPLAFDLSVRDAELRIDSSAAAVAAGQVHTMVLLGSEQGHPFWTKVPAAGDGPVKIRLYSGCYTVDVYGSDLPGYPERGRLVGQTRVGNLCTCDRN
jgi:hypothetical protein